MPTFIPRIPDKPSRLIEPSVNGASKPAVPVSFHTPGVTQTVMPPAPPVQPFHANAPANAPVQLALGEARDWVKTNSDKTGYPSKDWSTMPRASEIQDYINEEKAGWQELKAEYDRAPAKKARRKRPVKRTAAAASTSGSTSGSSSSTSSGISAGALKWQERKKKLGDMVDAANEAIQKASGDVNDFYAKLLNVPANIRVKIEALVEVSKLKLDREHSRLAYFSTSLLEMTQAASSVKKATPEIQTAIIEERKTNALSVEISGNTSSANSFLATALGGRSLEEGYDDTIKPFHVKRKARTLGSTAAKAKPQQLKKVRIMQLPNEPKIGDFERDDVNDVFVLKDGTGPSHTPDDFKDILKLELAYDMHRSTKTGPQNRQRKGARHFVKKHRRAALSTASVRVPPNADDIHAESAILEDLNAQTDKAIIAVGGTKVACTACQAYYTKHKQEALLGDNTSFAWLSASSLSQLGFEADKVTEYLEDIKKILNHRLNELRFFEGRSGTFGEENLVEESDIGTDSEDEAAITTAAESNEISDAVDEVVGLL